MKLHDKLKTQDTKEKEKKKTYTSLIWTIRKLSRAFHVHLFHAGHTEEI